MKIWNKLLTVGVLFMYLSLGVAEGADTVKFNPQWKSGEEAEYLTHARITLKLAEYPEFSGTIMDMQGKTTYQILEVTKKSTSLRSYVSDTKITSPFEESLPPALQTYTYAIQNNLVELSELADTYRLEYDLNQKGYLVRINNVDEQKQWVKEYFDLLKRTSQSNSSAFDFLAEQQKEFIFSIQEIPTKPQKVYGVHPTDFFRKSFPTGQKISAPFKIPLPKEPGKKALTLEIPGELIALRSGSSNQITTTYSFSNDDAANFLIDLLNRESPEEARQFQESWALLKTLGVRFDSDMQITKNFHFNDGSNWPELLTTHYEWTFILVLKPLKTFGGSELEQLPDSLHGRFTVTLQETKIN